MFWIAGKPASGKSTLVNYVANHSMTRKLMREAVGQDPVVAKFFFDFRAKDGIGNNFEGLRRSLLHQLLTTSKALAAAVEQQFGVNKLDDQIMLASVKIFEYVLQKNDHLSILFIDGLDEYQGHKPELLNLINLITKSRVKVCLSSRYEAPFTIAFKDLAFQFRMELINKPGIHAYAERTFAAALSPSNEQELRILAGAAEAVARISDGVFLWTRFAVSEIIDRVGEGHKIENFCIQRMILGIPPDLEQIYARLFQKIKEKDKKACAMIFRLIRSSKRELKLAEVFEAVILAGADSWSRQDTITSMDLDGFRRYLMSVGAGLIECVSASRSKQEPSVVRLIHRSVETYMCRRGWHELFHNQLVPKSDHEIWLEVCTKYLTSNHVRMIGAPFGDESVRHDDAQPMRIPRSADQIKVNDLRRYVYLYLLDHAYVFEQDTASSSRALIHHIMDTAFIREHVKLCSEQWRPPGDFLQIRSWTWSGNEPRSDVQLAVCHRLTFYVEDAITHCPGAFISSSFVSGFSTRYSAPSQNLCHTRWPTASVSDPTTSPLVTALLRYYRDPTPEMSNIILLLIPHSSRLEDTDMLMAVREASKIEIEALLTQFPRGPLYFRSKSLCHKSLSPGIDIGIPELPVEHPIGLLWELGGRTNHSEAAEILGLLLARGEGINLQCSLIGTILHSVIFNHLMLDGRRRTCAQDVESMFRMLITHGADINQAGPEGNVLEYVWKRAHTTSPIMGSQAVRKWEHQFGPWISLLVKLGATNSVCDPNGLVPSKSHMLTVAMTNFPSLEDRKYYFHGTFAGNIDHTGCRCVVFGP